MKDEIIKAEDYGLEVAKANELTVGLKVVRDERKLLIKEFEEVSKLELTQENLPKFKELRLKIVKNRTQGTNKWHKTNKEFFLTGGKFVDAIKNRENNINEQMEEKLMDAENHFENLEKERIFKIQSKRVSLLSEFIDDASERNLSSMDDEVWDAYLYTKKKTYLDNIQAELDAEKERQEKIKAEEKEQKRIRKENEKLKKEAEKSERLAKIETKKREKVEEIRNKREEELQPFIVFIRNYNKLISSPEKEYKLEFKDIKKGAEDHWEFEKKEKLRKLKEEEDRINKECIEREKQESKLKAERESKLKAENELKSRLDAERKAKEDKEARIQSELNKGDSDKVKDLITALDSLKNKYTFKSSKNKKMYKNVGELIDKVTNYIKK